MDGTHGFSIAQRDKVSSPLIWATESRRQFYPPVIGVIVAGDQVDVGFWIENGSRNVTPCEPSNVVEGVPKRNGEEMGSVILDSVKQIRSAVASRGSILRQARPAQILGI
jgi:hypothetical protein